MRNNPRIRGNQRTTNAQRPMSVTRRCHECNEEALGRCPDCHLGFCQEHFSKQQHSPCAEKQMKMAQTQVCYVCGTQVYPDQWSVSKTSHYVDPYMCRGCGRYVCDELHTQRKVEEVVIIREGMRGHRYQYTNRYCDMCAPLHRIGGIKGLARTIVVVGTIAAAALFYFRP
ncbi:MAG TPA: hypothetical protein VFB12_29955 [Ktedonobacteraceae bacterium]|nr:hypothetical protein [Ktedonobacteraceae bacterium]